MKIHHIALTVNNLEESRDFYINNFGFELEKSFERPDLKGRASFIRLNDIMLELWEFEDMKKNVDDLSNIKIRGMRHFALAVKDIDFTVAQLKARGLTLSKPNRGASGHMYVFTTDPNGIAVELYESDD